jgi:hypothetical protein
LDPDGDASVDIIRTLIFQGQNDPLNLDVRGDSFITSYIGNAEGYLWILRQEEFEVDILHAGDRPLHVIARSLGAQLDNDITCTPSRSWEPVLNRLIELGLSPIPKGLKAEGTPLDTLLMSIENQVTSCPIAQEWLSLLASVGVDTEEYFCVERDLHNSRFVSTNFPGLDFAQTVPRRIIFGEAGNTKPLNIEWKWFYTPESPAHLALIEFSSFGNLLLGDYSVWRITWPFIYIDSHKDLPPWRSLEGYQRHLSKLRVLQSRWTRQALRREQRSQRTPRFDKPSRSERRIRVPGSWVEDHGPVSISWQTRQALRTEKWLIIFILFTVYFLLRLGGG